MPDSPPNSEHCLFGMKTTLANIMEVTNFHNIMDYS